MPQFDQSSFLSQVFWLFFFLSNFYIVVVYWWLPISSTVLKFRKKKVYQNQNDLTILSLEHYSRTLVGGKMFQQNLFCYDETLKQIFNKTYNISDYSKTQWIFNAPLQNCLSSFWVNIINYPKHFK